MQRAHRQERKRRIDEIAKTAVEHLSIEAFAFSIPEVCHRIMAEGVLERISQKEAQAAMERLKLVKLGRMERGKNRKDVYVTTEANIRQEHDIIERMKQTKAFVKKVPSHDFAERIQKMVRRGYVENNERYHVPEKKSIGELLASVKWKPLEERVPDIGLTDAGYSEKKAHTINSPLPHSIHRREWVERSEDTGR